MWLLASFLLSHNSKNISHKLIKQCVISKALTSELLKVLVKNRIFTLSKLLKSQIWGMRFFFPLHFQNWGSREPKKSYPSLCFPPVRKQSWPSYGSCICILRAVLPHWVTHPNQHWEDRRLCPKEARRADKKPPWLERGTSKRRRKTRERCQTQGLQMLS